MRLTGRLFLPLEVPLDPREIYVQLGRLQRALAVRVISCLAALDLLAVVNQCAIWVCDGRTPASRLALGCLDIDAFDDAWCFLQLQNAVPADLWCNQFLIASLRVAGAAEVHYV
jgi:hypothetical protein